MNMLTLELRPYDPELDELRNGWDALSVEQATAEGKNLYTKFLSRWMNVQMMGVGVSRPEWTAVNG